MAEPASPHRTKLRPEPPSITVGAACLLPGVPVLRSRRDFLGEVEAGTDADCARFELYMATPQKHNAYLAAGPDS